jgi:FMN-dependent NADH-azoreductase
LKSADNIVLAFPTYNFSFPAIVKAWFDQVMLAGHTFKYVDGAPVGLLENKKALILNASGAAYDSKEMQGMEHALSLGKVELSFMGIQDIEIIAAAGVNMQPTPKDVEKVVTNAAEAAKTLANKWFSA